MLVIRFLFLFLNFFSQLYIGIKFWITKGIDLIIRSPKIRGQLFANIIIVKFLDFVRFMGKKQNRTIKGYF